MISCYRNLAATRVASSRFLSHHVYIQRRSRVTAIKEHSAAQPRFFRAGTRNGHELGSRAYQKKDPRAHVCSACSSGDVTPALLFSAVGASFRAGGALAGPFAYIFINTGCGAAAMGPMRGGGAAAKGPRRRGAAANEKSKGMV